MSADIKVIKLTSGDTIVGKLTFEKSSSIVTIENPVQYTMMYRGQGEGTLVAQQWIETDETLFEIHRMQIVASAEPNEMLREYYQQSLEDLSEEYEEDEFDNQDIMWPDNKLIH